jgi:hypothetical protein
MTTVFFQLAYITMVDGLHSVDWSGRRELFKNAIAFSWCDVYSRMLIQNPAVKSYPRKTPEALNAEKAPDGLRISTDLFKRAFG